MDNFQNLVYVHQHIGGPIGYDPILTDKISEEVGEEDKLNKKDKSRAQDQYLATTFTDLVSLLKNYKTTPYKPQDRNGFL